MKNFIHGFIGFCLIWVGLSTTASAQTITVSAPSAIGINQKLNYTVQINAEPDKIAATDFGSFKLISGPMQNSSYSISFINGEQTSVTSFTYTYILKPTSIGEQDIPGITFVVDGAELSSNPIHVTVTKKNQDLITPKNQKDNDFWGDFKDLFGKSPEEFFGQQEEDNDVIPIENENRASDAPAQIINTGEDIFINATVSNYTPYVGEMVVINYSLYSKTENIQGLAPSFPEQPDFQVVQLNNLSEPRTVKIQGVQYFVRDIYRIAAYPQRAGEVSILPLELDSVILIQDESTSDPQTETLYSDPIRLNVIGLPSNKPPKFNGVVGELSLKASLSKTEMKANDTTHLVITVTGNGNLQRIEKPSFHFPALLSVEESETDDGAEWLNDNATGSRTFSYIITPHTAGNFYIPAYEFYYFDTLTKRYKLLSTGAYDLKVE